MNRVTRFSEAADLTLDVWLPDEEILSAFQKNISATSEELQKGRVGVAYCVRKGTPRQNDLINEDAICIDGRSTDEIINILKNVKYFISFDPETFYLKLAVALGCYSMVSCPIYDGKETDAANERPHLAFSPDQIKGSWKGRSALLQQFEDAASLSRQNVAQFYEFWVRRINMA